MVYNEEDYIDSAEYILRNVLRAKVQLVTTTGRQLPPLSSVLYRIISKRCYILAAALIAISLACLLVQ